MADRCFVDPDYSAEERQAVLDILGAETSEPPHYLLEDAPKLTYNDTFHMLNTNVHQGQRKLLLSEMEFLNRYYNSAKKTLVLYIGAGPGNHIPLLTQLYPDIDFELWDPVRFQIAEKPNMRIYNDYFTDESARRYINWREDYDEFLVISDIRTPKTPGESFDDFENKVGQNMIMQQNWIDMMKPTMTSLKFRVPFNVESIDYLDGEIFIQPWAPIKSAETRLFTDGSVTKTYELKDYEDRMYYHNIIRRQWQTFNNVFDYGLDKCYDCAAELSIIRNYLKWKGNHDPSIADIKNYVLRFSNFLQRPLYTKQGHGKWPDMNVCERRERLRQRLT